MVCVQIFAFGKVQDNRVRKKSAKAAKIEKEKLAFLEEERRKQIPKLQRVELDGVCELHKEWDTNGSIANGNGHANGSTKSMNGKIKKNGSEKGEPDSEESLTETSEEEMFI